MKIESENPTEAAQDPQKNRKERLKPYSKPVLEELGDLRDVTLGGSPGVSDSGNSFTENWPI